MGSKSPTVGMDRTERLLALILLQGMKGAAQRDRALQLSVAGFSNLEIADILGMTSAGVSQALYEVRRPKRRGPKRAGAASKRPKKT